jgi:Hemerythrin HHE cation binding domain
MEDAVTVLRAQHADFGPLFEAVSDPEADRVAVLGEIVRRMAAHVSVEQSILLPILKEKGVGADRLVRDLKSDYLDIGHLLVKIERRRGSSPDLPGMVSRLIDIFDVHSKRFDRFVYPTFDDDLDPQEREDIVAQMDSAEALILSHPHPHLLSLGPVSRITTKLAALHDRLRDRSAPGGGFRFHRRPPPD